MDILMTEDQKQMTKCQHRDMPGHGHSSTESIENRQIMVSKSMPRFSIRTSNILLTIFTLHCLLFMTHNYVEGFNLDVKFPTLVTIPEKKSYFGYTVGMYSSEGESWLIVGAPKSLERGEIYKCKYEVNTHSNCTRIKVSKDDVPSQQIKDMFGMTMLTGEDKQLMGCAPFYTQKTTVVHRRETNIYYDMLGICYFMEDFTMDIPNVFKLIPCQSAKGSYHDGDSHGTCQAGFSAAFTKDHNNILLGATGSFYRQGSIMLVPLPITNDLTALPMHTGENKPVIPPGWNRADYITQSYDDNYLGYSVATGKTINDSQLLFVSAPRRFGFDLLGMVIVFNDGMDAALYNFTGTQTGEYFGCGLAAIDLNADGLDDLIIGAPLYTDYDRQIIENGRIYIFYQTKAERKKDDGLLTLTFSEPVIIEGKVGRARFGHVISAIGDVNQDGYDDVAVGAPYTINDVNSKSIQSDGSVFIFNGGPEGMVIPASQEIKGMKLDESLTAFGSSIVGQKDVDSNGYPDVLTGAYMSDQAVLIRSRPVVEISSKVTVNPETIEIESKSCPEQPSATSCFKITTCFSYTGKNLPPSIQLSYTYDVDAGTTGDDKRAYVIDEAPRNLTLLRESKDKSEVICEEEYAYLKVDVRDKLSDILVKVSHSLFERDQPVEPVLNQLKLAYASSRVKIFKDCGDDDICQADLRVTSALDKNVIYVGQEWPLSLQTVVKNYGEPAFLTMLVVEIPSNVYYVGVQDNAESSILVPLCTNIDKFVTCEIGNPLKRDEKVSVNLKFQTYGLHGNMSGLTFKSFANSTNPTNNTSPTWSSPLVIDVKSDIVVYNSSSPVNLFLKDSDRENKASTEGNMTSVIHTYELINSGPSDIAAGTIEISWPLRNREGKPILELAQIVEGTKADSSISCNPVTTRRRRDAGSPSNMTDVANYYYCDGRVDCATVTCDVGKLRKNEGMSVTIHFMLPLSTVLETELDSYIRSDLKFKIEEYPYMIHPGEGPTITSEITTNCLYVREPSTKEVQWWIIAIAVGVGLLMLLILIFALWRCGFFVRKRKPDNGDQSQHEKLNPNGGIEEDDAEMEQYLK
ncbi:integrin alpha-V-like [Styela clava]